MAHLELPTVYNSGIYSSILHGYLVFLYFLVTLCRASVVHYCLLENECTRYLHFVPITQILLLFSFQSDFDTGFELGEYTLFASKRFVLDQLLYSLKAKVCSVWNKIDMAIPIVEFPREGYKIRKVFG